MRGSDAVKDAILLPLDNRTDLGEVVGYYTNKRNIAVGQEKSHCRKIFFSYSNIMEVLLHDGEFRESKSICRKNLYNTVLR